MSETNRYYAATIARVTKALRGGAARFNRTLEGEFHPLTEALTAKLFEGGSVAWDLPPLRGQSWEVFGELSMLVDLACRVQGQEVGWDAWSGTRRLLIPLMDWHPLDESFARRFSSRPVPPFYFAQRHMEDAEGQTPYIESFPHGFFLRSEFDETIAPMLQLIESHYRVLTGERHTPVSDLVPGQPIDARTRHALLLDESDERHIVWQYNRMIPLYNALCEAQRMDTDLFCVGY